MEKISEAYLDSSVFIASILDSGTTGENARNIILSVQNGLIKGYTSTLTFDEVSFVIRKFAGLEKSLIAGESFLKIPHLQFIDVSYDLIFLAQEFISKYKIKPRDAIHCACANSKYIGIIISDDADFDRIKEIKRLGIQDVKLS